MNAVSRNFGIQAELKKNAQITPVNFGITCAG